MKKILTCLLTVLGLTSACSQQNQRSLAEGKSNFENRRTKQEQNGARSSYALQGGERQYANTDVQGFAELIADSSVVILDVRTAAEYAEGHIQGAVLIDQGQSDFMEKAKEALPTDKTIAMYCRSGRRSANAAGKLADVGYKCVNLKGGIMAWMDEKKPTVK